ncbi:DUF5789 family protein [Halalkalicoccus ordinarius]|uniref:DUF5789 family protein n=1 Tax=Halalkalicoccus ordinarius TaxID=3116651 RepID=UPI00300F7310
MTDEVKLSDCASVFGELNYPVDRTAAADELSEVTILLADGETHLGELITQMTSETFDSAGDIETELHNVLPREAVGEPYQSEGEG